MCAIIGAVIKNPSLKDFEALKRVFIESKIRGMHATGISFLPRWTDEIVTVKEPGSLLRFGTDGENGSL